MMTQNKSASVTKNFALASIFVCLAGVILWMPQVHAEKGAKAAIRKKLVNANRVVITKFGEKTAIVKDPKIVEEFVKKYSTHGFNETGVGAIHEGYVYYQNGDEILHVNPYISRSCLKSSPLRQEFFKSIDKLFVSHGLGYDELIKHLNSSNKTLRYHVTESLRTAPAGTARAVIEQMQKNPRLDIRSQSAGLLSSYVKQADAKLREEIFQALTKACETGDSAVKASAVKSLMDFGERAIPVIQSTLKSSDVDVKTSAAYCLSELKAAPDFLDIKAALKIDDDSLRFHILEAAQFSRDKRLVPLLLQAILGTEKHPHHYHSAAITISRITGINKNLKHFMTGSNYDRAKQKEAIALWKQWAAK